MKVLNIFFVLLVFLLLFSQLSYANSASQQLNVISAKPQPNYRYSADDNDLVQLTDKVFTKFPNWVRRNSVGWQYGGYIEITLNNVNGLFNGGELVLTLATNTVSDVNLPASVDVYGLKNSSSYWLGGKYLNLNQMTDKGIVKIAVPLAKGKFKNIKLMILPNGRYLMMDEIEYFANVKGGELNKKALVSKDLKTDAKSRIKNRFFENKSLYPKKFEFFSPWQKIYTPFVEENISLHNNGWQFIGINTLGLNDNFKINTEHSYKLFRLETVFTKKLEHVYDPAIPVALAESYKPGIYLLQLINIADNRKLKITAKDLDVTKNIVKKPSINNCYEPSLNVWGYLFNKQVWQNPSEMINYLTSVSKYVAVIGHLKIMAGKKPDAFSRKKLIDEMLYYKKANQILVYFALKRLYRNGNYSKELLVSWLDEVNYAAKVAGVENKIVIYPIDEVDKNVFDFNLKVIKAIKSHSPDMKVYANPMFANKSLELVDLKRMSEFIDIWQPHFGMAIRYPEFFKKWDENFWVYGFLDSDPDPVVKSRDPIKYYEQPIKAMNLGAKGVGFWSLSDASKGTVWDDFDGKRPDYAVLYDPLVRGDMAIPSRRWLAYMAGYKQATINFCKL